MESVEELEEEALDVGRPTFVEPEVCRVRLAAERVCERLENEEEFEKMYVTPFPNHE